MVIFTRLPVVSIFGYLLTVEVRRIIPIYVKVLCNRNKSELVAMYVAFDQIFTRAKRIGKNKDDIQVYVHESRGISAGTLKTTNNEFKRNSRQAI